MNKHTLDPATDLSTVDHSALKHSLGCRIYVGILEHDCRIISAKLEHHSGHLVGSIPVYSLTGRDRTSECRQLHQRMSSQLLTNAFCVPRVRTCHDVDNARWKDRGKILANQQR